MAIIKLIAGTEDVPQLKNLQINDDDGWWNGVCKEAAIAVATVAAAVALTTAVAIHTVSQPQDDPAGNLYNPIEEVYWQNQTAPVQNAFYQNLPLSQDRDDYAPPVVTFTPVEDYWAQPPPQQASFVQLQPWPVDEQIVSFPTDEDFWTNWVQPVPASFASLYSFDDAVWVAPAVIPLSPDEDFWQNPVQPIPATFAQLYAFDAGEWVAPAIPLSPDEDYWQNQVLPVQATMYVTLPLGDKDEIPAGNLVAPVVSTRPNSIRMGIFNL